MNWIDQAINNVAELPDRNSPTDWPEAMLVTADELRHIIAEHAPPHDDAVAALTALMNDPAVIKAAKPGDIGRALCVIKGI